MDAQFIPSQNGAFFDTLKRNNKQIREDRAEAIAELAETMYKRKIEDLTMEKKRLLRDRESLMDLSATDKNTLVVASDFKPEAFIDRDIEIGLKVRELDIRLEVASKRYDILFTNNNKTSN